MKQFLLFYLVFSSTLLCAQYDENFCPCQLEGLVTYNVYESDLEAVADYTTQYHTEEAVEVQRVEISFESTQSLFALVSTDDNSDEAQFGEDDVEEELVNVVREEAVEENIEEVEQELAFGQEALEQEGRIGGAGIAPSRRISNDRIKRRGKRGARVRLKKPRYKKYRGGCPSF